MTEPSTPFPESPYCRVRARVASIITREDTDHDH